MKEIPLSQGKVALVDDEDFDVLAAVKWYAMRDGCTFYAGRKVRRSDRKQTTEQMHRVVLARKLGRTIADSMHVDHENSDGLDNRRGNLREVTRAQNARNCRRHLPSPSSKYLGVTWHKGKERWLARICVGGKNLSLGCCQTELAAALAREAFIAAHPELHAKSNFMEGPRP